MAAMFVDVYLLGFAFLDMDGSCGEIYWINNMYLRLSVILISYAIINWFFLLCEKRNPSRVMAGINRFLAATYTHCHCGRACEKPAAGSAAVQFTGVRS